MINIIIEISLFLIIALLVGYTFGWFTAKAILKEKYEQQIKEELKHYKYSNEELTMNESSVTKKIEELEDFIQSKDAMIEKLTTQLSREEDKRMSLAKKYEEEMDAFLYERTEIIEKYKQLLTLLKDKEVDYDEDRHHASWFKKLFKEPSKS